MQILIFSENYRVFTEYLEYPDAALLKSATEPCNKIISKSTWFFNKKLGSPPSTKSFVNLKPRFRPCDTKSF